VRAAEQRIPPTLREALRRPEHDVGAIARRLVREQLVLRAFTRAPGDEVHDAAEGRCTVQRRGDALDDFDSSEIHRWDLK
jgi:hypothetical protein